jgi:chromosome partitioning protein
MIILIGGEKGGTGKTTLATNLACLLKQEGRDVLLIDTDKQGSASLWAATRDTLISEFKKNPQLSSGITNLNSKTLHRMPNIQKFGDSITHEIEDLKERFQDIIIDAGGRDSIELRASLTVCDFIFVPIQASQFDVWTLGALDSLVTQAKMYNKALKPYIIFNRASTNPVVNEVYEAEAPIKKEFQNFRLCKAIIRDRIVYRKAAKNGLAINELAKQDEKANNEMNNFYNEVKDGIQ